MRAMPSCAPCHMSTMPAVGLSAICRKARRAAYMVGNLSNLHQSNLLDLPTNARARIWTCA